MPIYPITQLLNRRDYPDRPIVGVGAVIVRGREVLLVRRASDPLRGEWSLPGGMLELGETLRQAVKREVLEETGLRVRADRVLEVFESITPDPQGRTQFHYVLIDFLCLPESGEPRAGSDVSEVLWAKVDQLDRFGLTKNAVKVIQTAMSTSP